MKKKTWILLLASRITINVSYRLTYPFLPAIARGLGISLERAALLVAARSLTGLAALAAGPLNERRGHETVLQLGMGLLIVGALAASLGTGFFTVLTAFAIMGFAKAIYDPTVQSFVSAHTPRKKRARAMGLIESAWAGSWFIGMPVTGMLMAHWGWRSPFGMLASAGTIMLCWTRFGLSENNPPSPPRLQNGSKHEPALSCDRVTSASLRSSAALVAGFFMLFANENMMIVYGAWMEKAFGLQLQALGFYSMVMGAAELAGEMTVAAFVDGFGKRWSFLAGLVLTGTTYALLPLGTSSFTMSLGLLMVMFFGSEFSIVTSFSYVSELDPQRRSMWLSAYYSSAIAGRLVGAFTGPWLWDHGGTLVFNSWISITGVVVAVFFLILSPDMK